MGSWANGCLGSLDLGAKGILCREGGVTVYLCYLHCTLKKKVFKTINDCPKSEQISILIIQRGLHHLLSNGIIFLKNKNKCERLERVFLQFLLKIKHQRGMRRGENNFLFILNCITKSNNIFMFENEK